MGFYSGVLLSPDGNPSPVACMQRRSQERRNQAITARQVLVPVYSLCQSSTCRHCLQNHIVNGILMQQLPDTKRVGFIVVLIMIVSVISQLINYNQYYIALAVCVQLKILMLFIYSGILSLINVLVSLKGTYWQVFFF